jgi:hypothetical protein
MNLFAVFASSFAVFALINAERSEAWLGLGYFPFRSPLLGEFCFAKFLRETDAKPNAKLTLIFSRLFRVVAKGDKFRVCFARKIAKRFFSFPLGTEMFHFPRYCSVSRCRSPRK